MAEPAARLVVVAHGPTARASALVLADDGPMLGPAVAAPTGLVTAWFRSPERACAETVAAWGSRTVTTVPALAGPDLGTWSGRPLADVAGEDAAGLQAWLTNATARPHGGETLAELVTRVGGWLGSRSWPGGPSVLVVTPLVARALTVAALEAPAQVLPGLDVGFGGRVLLSRSGFRWRLQELLRRPDAGTPP